MQLGERRQNAQTKLSEARKQQDSAEKQLHDARADLHQAEEQLQQLHRQLILNRGHYATSCVHATRAGSRIWARF